MDASLRPASIVLIGRNFEVSGRLLTASGERVSDHLNQPRSMVILVDAEVQGPEGFVTRAEDIAVGRTDILLAVPVEEAPPADDEYGPLLVSKARQRARMVVGEWVVDGNIHISADGNVERFINTGVNEFIPVTDVKLVGQGTTRQLPLVLVSRSHLALIVGAPS